MNADKYPSIQRSSEVLAWRLIQVQERTERKLKLKRKQLAPFLARYDVRVAA